MSIDWSKAREGATHLAKCTDPNFDKEFWCVENDDRYNDMSSQAYLRKEDVGRNGWLIYERPAPWTGEGLPPVGIEIEAMMRRNMHDDYAWRRAKVVHGCIPGSEGEVLVYDVETTSPAWVDEFRPIRTPEQIAAEERAAGITQMRELVGSLNSHPFAELWDAGYRKQPEL